MLVYSSSIQGFLSSLRALIRDILANEMKLKVHRQRFEYRGILYPINPVVFEHTKTLGFFEAHAFQIGVNKNLIGRSSHKFLKDLLRHELCHFFMYITQKTEQIHGLEFRNQCKEFGWGEEVYSATTSSEGDALLKGAKNQEEAKILSKVKKLLSLSQSSNQHEAEVATAKANQLIMEHNLQITSKSCEDTEEHAYVLKVLHAKRNNQKLKSIYEILKLFMVQPVFSYSQNSVYLEVIGEKIHVEMADYIAKYLDNEMDCLWKLAKTNNPELKGKKSKNSFIDGMAIGFCKKIKEQRLQANIPPKSLVALEKQLERKVEMVYTRLSSTNSQIPSRCEKSKGLGQKMGASLNIRKGVSQNSLRKLLSF